MKRNRGVLLMGAVWMLIVHLLDIYWMIMPVHHHHGVHITVLDVTTFVGVGGIFLAAFGLLMKRAKVIPTRDPRLGESLAFENIV
jgi:apolipoprotein N-acyltransferase